MSDSVSDVLSGDIGYETDDFEAIQKIVHERAGIALGATKRSLVYSRVSRRLRLGGFSDFQSYLRFVTSPSGVREMEQMIDALTTNVTNFFREKYHFDHLASTVVPGLVTQARRGEKIRLWSSACSSGQEAYSMALVLLDRFPDVGEHDVRILATDINAGMVEKGMSGRYDLEDVQSIPRHLRERWMKEEGDKAVFLEPVRRLVAFRRLNLLDEWPMKIPFSVIFCRNVAIYFDRSTQDRLWQRLAGQMRPGGYLYIGHSEKISAGLVPMLDACSVATTYRREA